MITNSSWIASRRFYRGLTRFKKVKQDVLLKDSMTPYSCLEPLRAPLTGDDFHSRTTRTGPGQLQDLQDHLQDRSRSSSIAPPALYGASGAV